MSVTRAAGDEPRRAPMPRVSRFALLIAIASVVAVGGTVVTLEGYSTLLHDAGPALGKIQAANASGQGSSGNVVATIGFILILVAVAVLVVTIVWRSETQRRRLAAAQMEAASLQPFHLLFYANPQPMWVFDRRTLQFLAVNDAAVQHYGYSRDEFLAMSITDVRPADDIPRMRAELADPSKSVRRSAGWRHVCKSGRVIDVEVSSHPLYFNGCDAVLVTIHDVTTQLAVERQLREQTFRDSLTGLPNRALFKDRVEHALQRADRAMSRVFVMVIDIDDFKTINDMYGRAAGDQLLIQLAARFDYATRDADTVARLSGDEFGVLLEGATREVAERVIADIFRQMSEPFSADGIPEPLSVTCCIGVADTSKAGNTCEALLRSAGAAALTAKTKGLGRFEMYEATTHGATVDRLGLAGDLRGALSRSELRLEFQPIVALPDGEIRGAEALLRWQHPTRGLVVPADFIPIAERTGLIIPIGVWVLRTALTEAAKWPSHASAGALSVSVNVSTRQLREPGFGEDVVRVLQETGFDPRRLILEITESVLLDDIESVRVRLAELRSLGIRIALDDFGAGYSSLGYLRTLPLDVIKIDRMFVSSLADRSDRRSLLLGVIRLPQTLRVITVAEGIETVEQLEYLAALGVDHAQGFYFARPFSSEAMRHHIDSATVGPPTNPVVARAVIELSA